MWWKITFTSFRVRLISLGTLCFSHWLLAKVQGSVGMLWASRNKKPWLKLVLKHKKIYSQIKQSKGRVSYNHDTYCSGFIFSWFFYFLLLPLALSSGLLGIEWLLQLGYILTQLCPVTEKTIFLIVFFIVTRSSQNISPHRLLTGTGSHPQP